MCGSDVVGLEEDGVAQGRDHLHLANLTEQRHALAEMVFLALTAQGEVGAAELEVGLRVLWVLQNGPPGGADGQHERALGVMKIGP